MRDHGKTNTWDIFTAKAEYTNPVKDQFGRVTSLAAAGFDVTEPSVSRHLFDAGFRPHYPDGQQAVVCLSHDVDVLLKPTSEKYKRAASALKKLSVGNALAELQTAHYPQWEIKRIYDLEIKHNARSTFFFLSLIPGERDFNYPLSYVSNDLKFLKENNFEIALHGNFNSATEVKNVLVEKQRLENAADISITGYRNHYLCFETDKSWDVWQQANIKHDSTFGFANMPGFRNGMCYPFRPFSLIENRFLDIVELPLIVMDATLFNYLRLDTENAFAVVRNLFEKVRSVNGVLTLLWHNHFMHDEYGALYERLLDYFQSQNAWMPTHGTLVEWWKQNNWLEQTAAMLSELQTQPKHDSEADNR